MPKSTPPLTTHIQSDPLHMRDRMPYLIRRNWLRRACCHFLESRGYIEVETPYAVRTPGEEVHLFPFSTEYETPTGTRHQLFLHTSPEFAMKRIVSATNLSIFQFARVWRNAENSPHHAAEFTMLEWYRPDIGLDDLMDETEALLQAILPPVLQYGSLSIDLCHAFERLTIEEAFGQYAHCHDLLSTQGDAQKLAQAAHCNLREGENWEDLFFRLLLERVEPAIGRKRPTFLTHWPIEQAALACKSPLDPRVALRFELYLAGIELANAFEELTDSVEQRARFEKDRMKRNNLYPNRPHWPIDNSLLTALPHMPRCSGIALGFDRLVMLACSTPRIQDTLWINDTLTATTHDFS
ncbi:MAG: EF-P lysine aminoacylase GenX [Acetobacter sp.]|nr:EF-P lysine aminoacylase GenX [Acetobacter sp.]